MKPFEYVQHLTYNKIDCRKSSDVTTQGTGTAKGIKGAPIEL